MNKPKTSYEKMIWAALVEKTKRGMVRDGLLRLSEAANRADRRAEKPGYHERHRRLGIRPRPCNGKSSLDRYIMVYSSDGEFIERRERVEE